jgi:hypothetical protein
MKKFVLMGLVVVIAVSAALARSATVVGASSTTTQCNNQTFTAMTISGNINVPKNAFCDLVNSHVTGGATVENSGGLSLDQASSIATNVQLLRNAQLGEFNGSIVGGSVRCERCSAVFAFSSSTVGGNVVEDAATQGAIIKNVHIGGNLVIHESVDTVDTPAYDVETNTIGGNLQFDDNRGSSTFVNNAITGTMSCEGNHPPPTGSGNTASAKRGQCASL